MTDRTAETMVVQLGDGKYAIGAGGNQETGYELWFSPLERPQEVGSPIKGNATEKLCSIRFRGLSDLSVIKQAIEHMWEHASGKSARWTVVLRAKEIPNE